MSPIQQALAADGEVNRTQATDDDLNILHAVSIIDRY